MISAVFLVDQILVFLGFCVFSYFLLEWRNGKKRKLSYPNPPSLPSLPFVGSLPFVRNVNNVAEFFMKKSDELGPIFTFRAGNKTFLMLNSKESIEEALVKHSYNFSDRPDVYSDKIVNINQKGIIFAKTSQAFKKYRHLSLSTLKELGFGVKNVMESKILDEVEAFVDYAKKKGGQSFNPKDVSILAISNIIVNIVFGRRGDYECENMELIHQIDRWSSMPTIAFDIAPFIKFIPAFRKKLDEISDSHVHIRRGLEKEIETSLQNPDKDCFLRRYLQKEGPEYDHEQLLYLLRDLIGAGTETTASTFRWLLIALANNPEVQSRLHAEIDEVVPRGQLPSLQDQARLPNVEATILEIFRWRTLTPLSVTRQTLRDTLVGGFFVPAGITVFPNLYAAHMNPKVWNDPDVFRPERFLTDDNRVIGRDLVIPFSLGRRSCLGEVLARAEIFLFVVGLVQNFVVLPPEEKKKIAVKPAQPIGFVQYPLPFDIRLVERE